MAYFPLFLTSAGREEVKRARDHIASIEQHRGPHGLLKGREEERLADLKDVTRRDFFEKLGTGCGVAGLVSLGVVFRRPAAKSQKRGHQEESGLEAVFAANSAISKEQLDQIINRIEVEFLEWEPIIRDLIEKRGGLPPGAVAQHFYAPFKVVKTNVDNPVKNGRVLARMHEQQDEIRLTDPNYFAYDTLDQSPVPLKDSGMIASFSPVRRSLHLNPAIDLKNPVDMLITYHEVMHAVQDANRRVAIQTQEDFQSYLQSLQIKPNGRSSINIITEIDAYGSELEIADTLMKGSLRSGKATMNDMMRALHPRPEQLSTVKMLHELASFYFPHGISKGQFSPAFVDCISHMYQQRGYDVYIEQ